MLDPESFLNSLSQQGIDFFAGVPDSLLKEFLLVIAQRVPQSNHHICANEGAAVAMAAGYHLSTGKTAMVYMQNSGLGNAVNPLFSLTHPTVYGLPLLLLIGWRGDPSSSDEPQHLSMGANTCDLLDLLQIPYSILDDKTDRAEIQIADALRSMSDNPGPYALLCRKNTFQQATGECTDGRNYSMTRQEAIEIIINTASGQEAIICTTGLASRELYQLRREQGQFDRCDFLNVGAMGHASQIALGVAVSHPSVSVLCLDGDGAAIMHMGALATIGKAQARNFKHIIINNGVHDSVGGQATAGFHIDLAAIAAACRYNQVAVCEEKANLSDSTTALLKADGPCLLEVRIKPGSASTLPRPQEHLQQRKQQFMQFLNDCPEGRTTAP